MNREGVLPAAGDRPPPPAPRGPRPPAPAPPRPARRHRPRGGREDTGKGGRLESQLLTPRPTASPRVLARPLARSWAQPRLRQAPSRPCPWPRRPRPALLARERVSRKCHGAGRVPDSRPARARRAACTPAINARPAPSRLMERQPRPPQLLGTVPAPVTRAPGLLQARPLTPCRVDKSLGLLARLLNE